MLRAFSTAATGMVAQQMIVDVIANNLANINTTGFKRSQIDFQDLMYVTMIEPGTEVASGIASSSGLEIGSGVRPGGTIKLFTQGEPEKTDRPLDVAIQGDGFFKVSTPSGETRYTRDGSFRIDGEGKLVTSSGCILDPSVSITDAAGSVSIASDGSITYIDSSGSVQTAGSIALTKFINPAGLSSKGGNLYAITDASGAGTEGAPGSLGMGSLQQGFLEKSNVQMVTELVGLIRAQRAYEINSRAIRAGDEMLSTATQLIR